MAEIVLGVRNEDAYWRLAKEFIRALIVHVNHAMREAGIQQRVTRRQVCEHAVFAIGNFFDQYWLGVDGQKVYPVLCFARQFLDSVTELKMLGPVEFPDKAVELHAMVSDEVEWYFNEREESEESVIMGTVGDNGG